MLAEKANNESKYGEGVLIEVKFKIFGESGMGRQGSVFIEGDDEFYDVGIAGYNRFNKWLGELPADGEEWRCRIVYKRADDTLMVRLVENLTRKREQEEKNKILAQVIGLEIIMLHVVDFEGENEELESLMLDAIQFFVELKNFAEEVIAKKKLLIDIKKSIKDQRCEYPISVFELLEYATYIYGPERYMPIKNQHEAIVSWLERDENVATIDEKGKRHFGCAGCSSLFRLTAGEYRRYLSEKGYKLRCPDCGASSI